MPKRTAMNSISRDLWVQYRLVEVKPTCSTAEDPTIAVENCTNAAREVQLKFSGAVRHDVLRH